MRNKNHNFEEDLKRYNVILSHYIENPQRVNIKNIPYLINIISNLFDIGAKERIEMDKENYKLYSETFIPFVTKLHLFNRK